MLDVHFLVTNSGNCDMQDMEVYSTRWGTRRINFDWALSVCRINPIFWMLSPQSSAKSDPHSLTPTHHGCLGPHIIKSPHPASMISSSNLVNSTWHPKIGSGRFRSDWFWPFLGSGLDLGVHAWRISDPKIKHSSYLGESILSNSPSNWFAQIIHENTLVIPSSRFKILDYIIYLFINIYKNTQITIHEHIPMKPPWIISAFSHLVAGWPWRSGYTST